MTNKPIDSNGEDVEMSVESETGSGEATTKTKSTQTRAEIMSTIIEQGEQMARRLPFVGHVTWLYAHSPAYRMLFVQDLEWRLFPPIMLEQCKLYIDRSAGQMPTAYVSWARLSASAEKKYIVSQKLAPGDWKSGDRLWLVDFLTPFGGTARIVKDLRQVIGSDKDINLLYPDSTGNVVPITLEQLSEQMRSCDTHDSEDRENGQALH